MLQEIVFTPSTVAVIALLAAWAVWAVRRMTTRGLCDCGSGDGAAGCSGGCAGCAKAGGCSGGGEASVGSCPLAEATVEDIGRALR